MRGLERVAADRRALVARQVRTSTGFTWGRTTDGVARIAPLGVTGRAQTARRMPHDLPERLLAWVRGRSRSMFLPHEAALLELLGIDREPHAVAWLAEAWSVLEARGAVRVRRGARANFPGEWLVVLCSSGAVHRSGGAPMAWVEAVA